MKQHFLYLCAFVVLMVFSLPFDNNGQTYAVAETRCVKLKCKKTVPPLKESELDIITQHPLLLMN